MAIGNTIDWLSLTYPLDTLAAFGLTMGAIALPMLTYDDGKWEAIPGMYGYMRGYQSDRTTRVYDQGTDDMGVHIVYPGRALADIGRGAGLLREHIASGANLSRIDLAVDTELNVRPEALYDALQTGDAVTPARSYSLITGTSGATLYVGRRASDRLLRVYDKAAEQGLPGVWIRIELEAKSVRSRAYGAVVAQTGTGAIPGLIRAFCDFPTVKGWVQAMSQNKQSTPDIGRKVTNTRQWLLGPVVKALATEIRRNPAMRDTFMEALDAELHSNPKVAHKTGA